MSQSESRRVAHIHVEIRVKKKKKKFFESLVLWKFRKITAISHPCIYLRHRRMPATETHPASTIPYTQPAPFPTPSQHHSLHPTSTIPYTQPAPFPTPNQHHSLHPASTIPYTQPAPFPTPSQPTQWLNSPHIHTASLA